MKALIDGLLIARDVITETNKREGLPEVEDAQVQKIDALLLELRQATAHLDLEDDEDDEDEDDEPNF